MRMLTALLLLTQFSVSACETTKYAAEALRPDKTNPERFICELGGTRPKLPPEYVIDWSKVTTIPQAKAEHEKFVATIRSRENVTVGYILHIEGKLFVCFNNVAWMKDYYRGLDTPQ